MRALTNNLFTNCTTLQYESMWTIQVRVYLRTYESLYSMVYRFQYLATSVLWLLLWLFITLNHFKWLFFAVTVTMSNDYVQWLFLFGWMSHDFSLSIFSHILRYKSSQWVTVTMSNDYVQWLCPELHYVFSELASSSKFCLRQCVR